MFLYIKSSIVINIYQRRFIQNILCCCSFFRNIEVGFLYIHSSIVINTYQRCFIQNILCCSSFFRNIEVEFLYVQSYIVIMIYRGLLIKNIDGNTFCLDNFRRSIIQYFNFIPANRLQV